MLCWTPKWIYLTLKIENTTCKITICPFLLAIDGGDQENSSSFNFPRYIRDTNPLKNNQQPCTCLKLN